MLGSASVQVLPLLLKERGLLVGGLEEDVVVLLESVVTFLDEGDIGLGTIQSGGGV